MSKQFIPSVRVNDAEAARSTCLSAALTAHERGLRPIPVKPRKKKPAVAWDPWIENLGPENLELHWANHPDDDLGVVLTDQQVVFDADTQEGVEALRSIEKSLGITCNRIVRTKKGEHHHYRFEEGVRCTKQTPSKHEHPERFDILTGRAMVIIPPSTDKEWLVDEAESIEDLVALSQQQLDAFLRHIGRDPESGSISTQPRPKLPPSSSGSIAELQSYLKYLDPDMGYDDWLKVLMVIFYHSGGSDEGQELADQWSFGGKKYNGPDDIEAKWNSFNLDHTDPPGIGSLNRMVRDTVGEAKFREIENSLGPQWDLSVGNETPPTEQSSDSEEHPLAKYSLMGRGKALKKEFDNHEFVMGKIAIRGQWTVLYSPPNTGKTLLTLWMLIQAIKRGVIDPSELYYINADDGGSGIATKGIIADKHGFNLIVPGFNGFKTRDLTKILAELTARADCSKTIVVLDTLKKFTDLMNKSELPKFGGFLRQFTAKGGTIIVLAHANKNRDQDGKLVYQGATDIVDDADCMYMIDTFSDSGDVRTVELENRKSRGDVVRSAVYQYSIADGLKYPKLLKSVREVEGEERELLLAQLQTENSTDRTMIELTKGYIAQGHTSKTDLVTKLAEHPGVSRAQATQFLESHTGSDPIRSEWSCTKGAHNKHTYAILSPVDPDPAPPQKTDKEE